MDASVSVRLANALLIAVFALPLPAAAMTDAEMCQAIQRDVSTYLATGHPRPCPYNLTRHGGLCGHLSAWARPSGSAPRCYFGDVTGAIGPNARGSGVREEWPAPPPCPGLVPGLVTGR